MKGHCRPRNKDKTSWELSWYVGKDENGKRKYHYVTFHGDEPAAKKELRRLLVEVDRGDYIHSSNMTLEEYMAYWLETYCRPRYTGTTFERWEEIIRWHIAPKIGDIRLDKLNALHIESYYANLRKNGRLNGKGGLSPQTVAIHHVILHKALKDAVKWQLVGRSPLENVTPPPVPRTEARVFTREETHRVLETAKGTIYYIPALISVSTSLRRGEVLALTWDDVDLETGLLYVRKSLEQTKSGGIVFKEPKTARSRRTLDIPKILVNALKEHKQEQLDSRTEDYYDHNLIVCMPNGKPFPPDNLSHLFKKLLRKAKVDGCFHSLRHTHATALLEKGENPKVVQERLGHAYFSTTMDRYSHVMPGMQNKAAKKIQDFLSD